MAGNGLLLVYFTVWENLGMLENYRLMIFYDYQEKRRKATS
jgi:hypothetical protein